MAKKEKIIVYSNESCPYCKTIKEKLKEEKIKFTEVSITENKEEWMNIVGLTGMHSVPTIFFKDNYFVAGRDFPSPESLIYNIKEWKNTNFPLDRQTFERIKTLNYGISSAFQGVEGILKKINDRLEKIENNYYNLFEDEETKTK